MAFHSLALMRIAIAIYAIEELPGKNCRRGWLVLRGIVFVILLFMVLQPVLNVSQVLPQDVTWRWSSILPRHEHQDDGEIPALS
jgi:hypothetical protein